MENNLLSTHCVVAQNMSDEMINVLKKEMRHQLFIKLSDEVEEGKWLAVRLFTRDTRNMPLVFEDPLASKLVSTIEIKPIETEYVKMYDSVQIRYKKHTGFFKRLKLLLFSSKPIYTEENTYD